MVVNINTLSQRLRKLVPEPQRTLDYLTCQCKIQCQGQFRALNFYSSTDFQNFVAHFRTNMTSHICVLDNKVICNKLKEKRQLLIRQVHVRLFN